LTDIGTIGFTSMPSTVLDTCAVMPAHSLLAHIGNTPLLRLERLTAELPGVEIYVKDESRNPGGSVKDRPALNMILEGERSGKLDAGKTVLDSTSGNTGIAYAMIGAAKGYRVKLCLPQNASSERKRILHAYGAEVVFTDPGEGSDGAIRKCREIYEADPQRYFYPDQYNNPANWQAHFETTAVEIMAQTDRRMTHFIAALGTSGTCMGVTRRLRQDMPHVQCISVQPSSGFHGLEGLKHMPTAIVPGIYDPALTDDNLWVETEDAYTFVRRAAREEGLLMGISSGANLAAAMRIGTREASAGRSAVIVTIICDGAVKYLSEHFWDDQD
jgi:S-sulfo-L-cysteine synthase (O-acetyl-L-serine-dependent)